MYKGLKSEELTPKNLAEPLAGALALSPAAVALRLPSAQQPLPGLSGRKTQPILEEKLRALEEECKQKETERVNLELELTEVKESLRKALAGGITLGLAIEPRSGTSSPQVVSAGAPEPLRGHGRPEGLPFHFLE